MASTREYTWDAQKIIDGLYLGSEDAADEEQDKLKLKEIGITHILVAGSYIPISFPKALSPLFPLLTVVGLCIYANTSNRRRVPEYGYNPIGSVLIWQIKFFSTCCKFIDEALSNEGKVLVHWYNTNSCITD